jgi:hypothetical protein
MSKQAILLVAALFLLAGVGRADWQEVEAMQAGAPVMVRSGFVTNAGKFVRASADAVTVETQSGQEVTVQKAEVDDVYVFRSHAERVHKGLLFGGVAAAATAATFFPLTATFVHPSYIASSVVTATNGVTFGLVGSRNRVKRIYRRN